jgi:hypothetical protein
MCKIFLNMKQFLPGGRSGSNKPRATKYTNSSVVHPGCFIPDLNFSISDPGFRVKNAQDPGSVSERYFMAKKLLIKVRKPDPRFFPSQIPDFGDPGVQKALNLVPGSAKLTKTGQGSDKQTFNACHIHQRLTFEVEQAYISYETILSKANLPKALAPSFSWRERPKTKTLRARGCPTAAEAW